MKGYIINIEQETLENTDYRRVLYTGKSSQLVVMCLMPLDETGEEIHELDQFIRFEEGEGEVIFDGIRHAVSADMAVFIPEGMKHNVINTGVTPLKLYSLYSPPEHKDGIVHLTKKDEKEEHFDGVTTE